MSFDTVLERIAQLPFEATMLSLWALAGALYHARYDTDLHWRLACDALIDGPVLEAVRRFLTGGPGRIVFDPRYITVFQRLLVEHSRTNGDSLEDEQARIVIACLLALPDALPKTSASDSNKIMHAAAQAVRLGSYHFLPFLHAYTRTYEGDRSSTRTKDLVDLALIAATSTVDAALLRGAIEAAFTLRGTHAWPPMLPAPPQDWAVQYRRLAQEVDAPVDLAAGHAEASVFLTPVLSGAVRDGTWNCSQQRWLPDRPES